MLLIHLLCVSLLFFSCMGEDASEYPEPIHEYVDGIEAFKDIPDLTYEEWERRRKEDIRKIIPEEKVPCNVPECAPFPCEQSGMPPFCPRNVTFCRSGCACIEYCKDTMKRRFCYRVKFCRTPRRFTPDDDFFSTLKMYDV